MTRVIIAPVNKIRFLINDLGKGIIRKIDGHSNSDEIGKMVLSVNNLSEKIQANATFAHETGLRNFDMPFAPLSDEDVLGKALLAMRENLKTGKTNLEIKNKELEGKNKELEEFAFVASHDLQEPLRTTSSFVGLLQQQYKGNLDEKADQYLTYISQASARMQLLITDLLDYSRIGTKMEVKPVDCNNVLAEVLADLGQAINETGAVITSGHLPVFCGYPTEIKLLFQNLVFNSIKFRKKHISPLITISAWQNKDGWQFAFADNGIGIAKEHFERIFIIFQRLHIRSKYQGSGIGLSHCKKIVELHKGKIWLESEINTGTTFYFTIPKNDNQ
jgi:light-regulated signal transduction histidine kinase (bacteriophytochrome)